MSAVLHKLCASADRWTPEDREIAQRRVPIDAQAWYATLDHSDYATASAGLRVCGSVRRQVRMHAMLEEAARLQACLQAAAPDLLAALRAYVEHDEFSGREGDPTTDRLRKARAAIAKATT